MVLRVALAFPLIVSLLETYAFYLTPRQMTCETSVPYYKRYAQFRNPEGELVLVDLYPELQQTELQSELFQTDAIDPDKVEFHLYTKNSPTNSVRVYINDSDALLQAGYKPKYKTKMLVHGFLNNLNSDTIQSIKNNFFSRANENYNVIAVDWSYYTSIYKDVVTKTKGVGQVIAQFLNYLVTKLGTSLDDLHCIGHSLGAHACGFGGAYLTAGKINRITGLDPALPGFNVTAQGERLSATDANFVDCIHTCAGYLGIEEPICSADFYPNGGKDQPGCPWYDFGMCSHSRSHEYFAESLLEGHIFPSYSCMSFEFNEKHCFYKGGLMGYPAKETLTGMFYCKTESSSPFAMNWTFIENSQ